MNTSVNFSSDTRPTLLAVLAHPDDESFGIGGTLAFYAWCGAEVHLICATGGEMGDIDPEHMNGYTSKAERRKAELNCAAAKLGLASVTMLGYRDSGMPGAESNRHPDALTTAPLDEVAAKVTHHIRRLRPQVIITFDPIGGYRHPDHIAIQRATVKAFQSSNDPAAYPDDLPAYQPQKLYFSTFPRWFLRTVVRLMPLFGRDPSRSGRNQDIDLLSIAMEDFPIDAEVDFWSVYQCKEDAAACHRSQGGGSMLMHGVFGWIFKLFGGRETFMRFYPPPTPGRRERDLFAGVHIGPPTKRESSAVENSPNNND